MLMGYLENSKVINQSRILSCLKEWNYIVVGKWVKLEVIMLSETS